MFCVWSKSPHHQSNSSKSKLSAGFCYISVLPLLCEESSNVEKVFNGVNLSIQLEQHITTWTAHEESNDVEQVLLSELQHSVTANLTM
jgi:hypothetical protein